MLIRLFCCHDAARARDAERRSGAQARCAQRGGANAATLITPFFTPPDFSAFRYFFAIFDAAALPDPDFRHADAASRAGAVTLPFFTRFIARAQTHAAR